VRNLHKPHGMTLVTGSNGIGQVDHAVLGAVAANHAGREHFDH
jgi:hypothetical protein